MILVVRNEEVRTCGFYFAKTEMHGACNLELYIFKVRKKGRFEENSYLCKNF